jgi:hypothetical protein
MRMFMLVATVVVMGSRSILMADEERSGPDNSDRAVAVIPEPRQVAFSADGVSLTHLRVIRVADIPEDRFAAELLRDALRAATGTECSVELLGAQATGIHELVLVGADQSSLPAPVLPQQAVQETEGYFLRTDADGVRVAAPSSAGLFYGVQTLIQLAEQAVRQQASIPGLTIRDWPEFLVRSAGYIEGAQAKNSVIVSRANIEATIRRLARYKLNYLTIEIYNLSPFASFPHCADANTLSLADWEALVELGRQHHVILLPSLQSFGQISEVIWNCDEGKPYRESTAPGLLCPSRPENIKFLQGLYLDLLTIFKTTPYLGIGCSEVWMQWNKKYCPLCQQRIEAGETEWDIYCGHVLNCTDAVTNVAAALGRDVRPLIWADEFYMYNQRPRFAGTEKMPQRMVMGHWQYFDKYWVLDNRHYDGIEGLAARGFDVLFVSACWPLNTYLVDLTPDEPRDGKFPLIVDSGVLNITDQARWAQIYQERGGPGTVLGGLCATFSQHDIRCWDTTWLGYVLHGDYTWGDPARSWDTRRPTFVRDFAASFYGARDEQAVTTIAQAYFELDAAKSDIECNHYLIRDIFGEYDTADGSYTNNSCEQSGALIRALMARSQGPGKTIADVRLRAERTLNTAQDWRRKLAALNGRVSNATSLDYLVLASHKIQNHAQRTLYLLDQETVLAALGAVNEDEAVVSTRQQQIEVLQSQLTALMDDTQGLVAEMRKLTWFSDDYATGYFQVMSELAALRKRLDEAQRSGVAPGH